MSEKGEPITTSDFHFLPSQFHSSLHFATFSFRLILFFFLTCVKWCDEGGIPSGVDVLIMETKRGVL